MRNLLRLNVYVFTIDLTSLLSDCKTPAMSKQLKLFKETTSTAFGGSLLKNSHAKTARPFSSKASIHLVLKARKHILKHYDRRVEIIIERQAKLNFIKIYSMQNVGNHIHLVIKVKHKSFLTTFLRSVCGLIPRKLHITKLWMQRPFTRIIKWGKAYRSIKNYMTINQYESMGYTRRQSQFMLQMDQGLIDLYAG